MTPPSVGVGRRPPSERNFYLLKVLNIDNRKLKIDRKERYEKIHDGLLIRHVAELRDELGYSMSMHSLLKRCYLMGWRRNWIEIYERI